MTYSLKGADLLDKLASLPNNYSLTDRVDACGYYIQQKDGSFKCDYESYFAAVKEAEAAANG